MAVVRRVVLLSALAALFALSASAEKPARDVVLPPKLIQSSEPTYTEAAREAKIEGRVTLKAMLGVDGRLTEIALVNSLGYGLDEKAIACVTQWQFRPARRDDEPVTVKVTLEVNFRLL